MEPRPGRRTRLLAALGFLWITVGLTFAVSVADIPGLWRIGIVEYLAIGLVNMVGVWRGRGEDDAWNRKMDRIQLAGFLVLCALAVLGALTFDWPATPD
jgi:hypothetical protein